MQKAMQAKIEEIKQKDAEIMKLQEEIKRLNDQCDWEKSRRIYYEGEVEELRAQLRLRRGSRGAHVLPL